MTRGQGSIACGAWDSTSFPLWGDLDSASQGSLPHGLSMVAAATLREKWPAVRASVGGGSERGKH